MARQVWREVSERGARDARGGGREVWVVLSSWRRRLVEGGVGVREVDIFAVWSAVGGDGVCFEDDNGAGYSCGFACQGMPWRYEAVSWYALRQSLFYLFTFASWLWHTGIFACLLSCSQDLNFGLAVCINTLNQKVSFSNRLVPLFSFPPVPQQLCLES